MCLPAPLVKTAVSEVAGPPADFVALLPVPLGPAPVPALWLALGLTTGYFLFASGVSFAKPTAGGSTRKAVYTCESALPRGHPHSS